MTADRGKVVQMVLRGVSLQMVIGVVTGIPAANGVDLVISNQLFAIKPWDPPALALATISLLLAAFTAGAIPAQRAASINPMQALRTD